MNHTDPEFGAMGTTMEASWDFEKSKALAERYGFVDFQQVEKGEMEVVRKDPEFFGDCIWRIR
jgi:hypothetical protein